MNLPQIQSNFKDLVANAAQPTIQKQGMTYVKFDYKTGDYLLGKEKEEVTDEEVLIFTPQLQYGYKWWDGTKFHDHFKPMLAGGAEYPDREGDWDEAASVVFAFSDGVMAEMSSSAHYLRGAANRLYASIFEQLGVNPQYIFPMVKLTSRSYESQFGGTNFSVDFKILYWCDENGERLEETKPAIKTKRRRA